MANESSVGFCPDISSGSILHDLARRRWGDSKPRLVTAYIVAVATTFLPLILAAEFGTVPLWNAGNTGTLTLFHDWGFCFAMLVSFPSLIVLLITDEQVLRTSLEQVHDDGVIVVSERAATELTARWAQRFRRRNIVGQLVAIAIGIGLALFTFRVYVALPIDSWIASAGRPHVAGYVYLYCITLLYALVVFYVFRSVTTSRFLHDFVRLAPMNVLPFHPDKCGGLRPVGRLGLRNQYTLTILGLNIALLLLVWWLFMKHNTGLRQVMIGASVAYLILGPVVFMAPLLPFRSGMIKAKEEWTREVSRLLRVDFARLRSRIQSGEVTRNDEDSIERLRKMGAMIDELPVWPFDARTLRSFGTAYIVPVGIPLIGKAVQAILTSLPI